MSSALTARRDASGAHGAPHAARPGRLFRMNGASAQRDGKLFDQVAAEYDRRRPTYPDELVDHACRVAGIGSGDQVLEVGCGSGQLTRGLVARGLRVTALEPGKRLSSLAQRNLTGLGEVEFVDSRFEDAQLRSGHFRAVFSASAFHWIDPEVSWQKAARVLGRDGTLALLQYFGLQERRSRRDQEALLSALAKIAPKVAAEWPAYRDLAATLAGADQRRDNVSEVWSWLGSHDVARAPGRRSVLRRPDQGRADTPRTDRRRGQRPAAHTVVLPAAFTRPASSPREQKRRHP